MLKNKCEWDFYSDIKLVLYLTVLAMYRTLSCVPCSTVLILYISNQTWKGLINNVKDMLVFLAWKLLKSDHFLQCFYSRSYFFFRETTVEKIYFQVKTMDILFFLDFKGTNMDRACTDIFNQQKYLF